MSRGCIERGVTINGDVDGRLSKTVEIVSKGNKIEAVVLAGYINSEEFLEFCKQDELYDSSKSMVKNNADTVKRLLRQYYEIHHKDIQSSATRTQAESLQGFNSVRAKNQAIDFTATIINEQYNIQKQTANFAGHKLDRKKVILDSINAIENYYITKIATPLYKRLKENNVDDDVTSKYKERYNEWVASVNKLKEINKDKKATKEDELKVKEDYIESRRKMLIASLNMIDRHGNIIEKNQSILMQKVKGDTNWWFNKAFESSKLVHIVNEFRYTLESDFLINENYEDDNDYINPNADSINQSSKDWVDKIWASFDKAVSAELKLYFNGLYKLASKGELGSNVYNYDTNNELGVPTTMGANFVIANLLTWGNFSSVNDFVNSIITMSQQKPDLYGFIVIANKCIKDVVFANKLFTNLANPKITKVMTILTEHGIDVTQSNKSSDAVSYIVYNMLNTTKSSMKDFYRESDAQVITELINRINPWSDKLLKDKLDVTNKEYDRTIIDTIYNILSKYYPNLNITALTGYIMSNGDYKNNIIKLATQIRNLITATGSTLADYNSIISEYYAKLRKYNNDVKNADLYGLTTIEDRPTLDLSDVNYDRLNQPIIEIAKMLVSYSTVKNELNSVNAEGNLTSDIIDNSYITNLLKQINYGNEQEADAGLKLLQEEVTKGEQYKYNTIFFGVTDSKGNTIKEGIFKRDKSGNVTVSKDARKIISAALFNGVKEDNGSKAVMYERMTKGDYFLTNMYTYFNPISTGEHIATNRSTLKDNFAGYFMRTPSDAPKNFVIQAPKYNTDRIVTPIISERDKYLKSIHDKYNAYIKHIDKYNDWYEKYLTGEFTTKKNTWSVDRIYELLEGKLDSIKYNGMSIIKNSDGTVVVPIIYRKGESIDIVFVKGEVVEGTSDRIITNISIEDIVTNNYKENALNDDFYIDINDLIINDGINSGQIGVTINKTVPIFHAIRQNLLNEINTFVDQLNNVFEKDNTTGEWYIKKSIDGLIDRAHYNDDSLVKYNEDKKRWELSGNFFTFRKLFDTRNFNLQKAIEDAISLYGRSAKSLIHLSENSGSLNTETSIVRDVDGRLVLNINEVLNTILDNITSNWITEYNKEIHTKFNEYVSIIEDRYNIDMIRDAALNYAVAAMAFDDIFEGDVKFYKDAQDFLKRAKEAQAGGKAYAGFNIADALSAKIKDYTDINGSVQPIMIGDISITDFANSYSPVGKSPIHNPASANARNGFRAITIHNTVRPSKYAAKIEKEIFDILKNKMSEEEAVKIAAQIKKGYAENTKTNDAQSFITIEEFIRRRWADGTLNEYQDILKEIYDVRTGKKKLKDIDLAKINARIQVQKNFYFDKHFDSTTRTYYPRQIKNAEFVLIPELLEGTDLKELYDIMTKYDIGQVNTAETSKAAKRNILTFWDNDGNVNPDFEQQVAANNEAAIEDYYYRFLYKQQEVQEHMKNEQNKAGIQFLKKIIDNADPSVEPHIKQLFDNYCANIREDYERLIYNMGWKINKDGSLSNIEGNQEILDFREFYERARHEAQRLGLDENFIEYLTPDEFGNPKMPNYMNNVSSKLESIAQAIFNSTITRQTLPGWHAAQVTQVGHGMKVRDSNGKLRELKYHPAIITNKETGEHIEEDIYNKLSDEDKAKYVVEQKSYAEVMIPRWSNLIPKDYSIEKLESEGLDIQIAYRIPTEGKQSISTIKVVGFLDDIYGSTIMLPDEWVTQTGSDFDMFQC